MRGGSLSRYRPPIVVQSGSGGGRLIRYGLRDAKQELMKARQAVRRGVKRKTAEAVKRADKRVRDILS